MKTQLLRPGFMIALSARIKGGVEYQLLDSDATLEGATLTKRRESTTTVYDKDEHDRATKIRNLARSMVTKHCAMTPFSLLCPDTKASNLEDAVIAAHKLVDDFNAESKYSKVSLYVMKAQLMSNDVENAKAVAEEMRSLLSEMESAVLKMDPEAIRESIKKANEVASMFQEEQQGKVTSAIELARAAAREITKSIKKRGIGSYNVAAEFRRELLAIKETRESFLDMDEPVALTAEEQAPCVVMKDLDMSDETDACTVPAEIQSILDIQE